MSRLLLTTLLWNAALMLGTAQDAKLFNQVVGSAGASGAQQGLTYSYTVGEVVISRISSGDRVLTQGFHQPEHTRIVTVGDPVFADWNIEVFPNPVSDVLTVRFSEQKGPFLSGMVVDLAGRIIRANVILNEPSGSSIDCSNWQAGVYFLVLRDPESRGAATSRIVRL